MIRIILMDSRWSRSLSITVPRQRLADVEWCHVSRLILYIKKKIKSWQEARWEAGAKSINILLTPDFIFIQYFRSNFHSFMLSFSFKLSFLLKISFIQAFAFSSFYFCSTIVSILCFVRELKRRTEMQHFDREIKCNILKMCPYT